jgi:hypothetical protein
MPNPYLKQGFEFIKRQATMPTARINLLADIDLRKVMDPLSQLFAAYLNTASSMISQPYIDAVDANVTTENIDYNGTHIRFQHQLWKIRPQSVCADMVQDSSRYASCTQQGKQMFTELCSSISKLENLSLKGQRIGNMYCNASLSYQPMIASIGMPKPKTAQELKQKECNQLILKAMQDESEAISKQRDEACSEAR